jgi:hypothetical protein
MPGVSDKVYAHMKYSPTEIMKSGAKILSPLLKKHGFRFKIISEGCGSGGWFCEAAFSHGNRILELHFRNSLGFVTYHIGNYKASHQSYMKTLEVDKKCAYRSFSSDPLDGFHHLLYDLERFGDDFLVKDGFLLRKAAKEEAQFSKEQQHQRNIGYVGDRRLRAEAREQFKAKNYLKVIELLESLDDNYPAYWEDSIEPVDKINEHKRRLSSFCKQILISLGGDPEEIEMTISKVLHSSIPPTISPTTDRSLGRVSPYRVEIDSIDSEYSHDFYATNCGLIRDAFF